MNPKHFADNLLEALHKPYMDYRTSTHLVDVQYALGYGKQKPAKTPTDWTALAAEAAEIEINGYSWTGNPRLKCPKEIRDERKRLIKKARKLLRLPARKEEVDGRVWAFDPLEGWDDPEDIFKDCRELAQWILEELAKLKTDSSHEQEKPIKRQKKAKKKSGRPVDKQNRKRQVAILELWEKYEGQRKAFCEHWKAEVGNSKFRNEKYMQDAEHDIKPILIEDIDNAQLAKKRGSLQGI
jgi:hypothetical protein